MADALLEIVIGNLQTFVWNELATIWGVDSQIRELSDKLTAIRAVLQDAEEKKITSHAVKDWLQKLSDAAYVLDDIMDECSIKSNRLQSEGCLPGLHRKTILFRYHIGKRMKEMVDRFHRIDEERRMFELPVDAPERQQEDTEWRQTGSLITEHQMYGRDQDREKIVEFLLRHDSNSDDLSVYPIVGMGGHGKTTLARWVFNDGRVDKHFDSRIWVCVSTDFDMKRILQSIVESTTGQNPNLSALDAMQKKVQKVLLGKRYLLVLDDVWDNVEWDKLKPVLHCGGGTKGASILVTTRIASVASIVRTKSTDPIHDLSPLTEDESWSLFKHHAFGPNQEERAEFVEIGKEIVRKCAGSPLATKALGSLLRDKNEEKQWLNVKESKFWDILEDDTIMRALRISYFNLKLSLRRCFSFCAIYPEGSRISKEQLIHFWIGNGLIKSRGSLEVEDVGNEAWKQLCQRSFFQEVKTDELGNITFKMHDLFHELAQNIMGEECKVPFESASMTNLSSSVHHINCSYLDKELNMDAFKKVESLRTFIGYNLPTSNFRGLPASNSLRALSTSSFQLSALKSLTHLRYLNLFDSPITTLPKCVSSLQKLQILKLEDCLHLTCLPEHLTQLKDLRHLLIKRCPSLVAMPPNIGELKCLKTLNIFIADSKAGFGLKELHDLQLGGKLHIKGLENVHSERDARDANLIGKKDLNSLYLSWDCSSDSKCTNAERVLEALEPHSNLKIFGMKDYGGTRFPSWMRNTSILSGLVNVILYDCKDCKQLPPLGRLPHLTNLFVSGIKDVKHIDDGSYDGVEEKAFRSLKKLTLSELPNLERMLRDERVEMLPLLSELSVSYVPKIKLPLLPSVEKVRIGGSSSSDDYYNSNEDRTSSLEAIVESVMHNVKKLSIASFCKLKVLPNELGSLSALRELEISYCDELESFSENALQGLSCLRTLTICSCGKLKSLSEGVRHLTCLERLEISGCEELVTLPSNMNQLTALRHAVIHDILPAGLQRVPSLQSLSIYSVDSLPEWLGDMTSLQQLSINDCPELRSLPSSFRRLTNLQKLSILCCPHLEKRCERETGEVWQNIAHIPQLELFPNFQAELEEFLDEFRSTWNAWDVNSNFDYMVEHVVDEL